MCTSATRSQAGLHHYVIRGGHDGASRLAVLARVMHRTTAALLDRVELRDGEHCLDVGCGTGEVTAEIALRVAPRGRAFGVDMDRIKLDVAQRQARARGARAEFVFGDIREALPAGPFDLIYARFLLSHLADPAGVIERLRAHLRPGGRLVLEDVDFGGYFVHPETEAFYRHRELFAAVVQRRGGDVYVGRRLPRLLQAAGFAGVGVEVVQPMALEGEVKLMGPLTLANIADAVVDERLATRAEVTRLVEQLYDLARDPQSLMGVPRIVQAWGTAAPANPVS